MEKVLVNAAGIYHVQPLSKIYMLQYKFGNFSITDRDVISQKRIIKKNAVVMEGTCYQSAVAIGYITVHIANTRMSVLTIMTVETEGHALTLKPLQPLGSSVIVNWDGMVQTALNVS